MSKNDKEWKKYILIGLITLLGGSGSTYLVQLKSMIVEAWKPYKIANEKRLEELTRNRAELEKINYNLLILQYQNDKNSLDEAIELAND